MKTLATILGWLFGGLSSLVAAPDSSGGCAAPTLAFPGYSAATPPPPRYSVAHTLGVAADSLGRFVIAGVATLALAISCSPPPDASRRTLGDRSATADGAKASPAQQAFVDLDHPYSGSKHDLFPNPEPRAEFLNYKRQLEYYGVNFVQLRPVEDIVANLPKYEGAYVSLTLPMTLLHEMEPLGSYEGLSFTWSDRRFGRYLFVCPIAKVAEEDWAAPKGWGWNTVTNTGSYFHVVGKIAGLTQAGNRLGGVIQIPTILVHAIDDGWRFASVSQATASARLAKAQQQEVLNQASREKQKDLETAVMMLSDLIDKVEVVYYEGGSGPAFILDMRSDAWHALPDRRAFLLSLAERIGSTCSQRKLRRPSSVAVWDRSDEYTGALGALGEWVPGAGVTILR